MAIEDELRAAQAERHALAQLLTAVSARLERQRYEMLPEHAKWWEAEKDRQARARAEAERRASAEQRLAQLERAKSSSEAEIARLRAELGKAD